MEQFWKLMISRTGPEHPARGSSKYLFWGWWATRPPQGGGSTVDHRQPWLRGSCACRARRATAPHLGDPTVRMSFPPASYPGRLESATETNDQHNVNFIRSAPVPILHAASSVPTSAALSGYYAIFRPLGKQRVASPRNQPQSWKRKLSFSRRHAGQSPQDTYA
jgi:hypothetical protein